MTWRGPRAFSPHRPMSTTFQTDAGPRSRAPARSRTRAHGHDFDRRELVVEGLVAVTLLAVAVAMAVFLPGERAFDVGTSIVLILLYAAARLVGFEIATGYTCPVVLVLVPMLFLLPRSSCRHMSPQACCSARSSPLARAPRECEGCPRDRAVVALGRARLCLCRRRGRRPDLADWPVYLLALGAMFATDADGRVLRGSLRTRRPVRAVVRPTLWVYAVDAALAPIGFLCAYLAADTPLGVLLVAPLIALLWVFARERTWRIDQAIELSGSYRGTALLLGNVLEYDHNYTGAHSRDVVELALAVGKRLA